MYYPYLADFSSLLESGIVLLRINWMPYDLFHSAVHLENEGNSSAYVMGLSDGFYELMTPHCLRQLVALQLMLAPFLFMKPSS